MAVACVNLDGLVRRVIEFALLALMAKTAVGSVTAKTVLNVIPSMENVCVPLVGEGVRVMKDVKLAFMVQDAVSLVAVNTGPTVTT